MVDAILDKLKSVTNKDDFTTWYAKHAKQLGLNPDPDDPKHFYDYRAAFKAGVEPDEKGHWPDTYKLPGHPTLLRAKEFSEIEAIIEKAKASFLENEDLQLADLIGTISEDLGNLIKPTGEEENEAIVEGIAETKSKKLATIDQIKEE